MNRIGWLLLLLFGAVIGGFFMLVRSGSDAPPPRKQLVRAEVAPSSGLVIPVRGIPPGQLYDSFDEVRGEEKRRHGAIDIPAPTGTLVIAAAPGRVEKLFDSEAGGHTIYVRSPDGRLIYYYAHLDRYADGLREGAHVARGQPIGTVGASGNADPNAPHLHFEVKRMGPGEAWHQGRAINPYPLLAGNLPSR